MFQVDLRTATIPLDRRVWRLFPGESYQFLESFREQKVGFLDIPGLELPAGKLADAKDLIPRIALSAKVSSDHWSQGPNPSPELELNKFADARKTQHRSRLQNAIISLYEVAKAGDYVVLPEPVFMSRIWVGTFKDQQTVKGFYPRRYGRTPIPARSIDWLGTFAENAVSVELSQSLRNQHPFTLLEKSLFIEVFSLAHGSFIYGDRHVSTVYNDLGDFLDADSALLGAISRLAAAALKAMDEGKQGLGSADLAEILIRTPPLEYSCSQSADIHSPGFTRYAAATIVPLVIAALGAWFIGLSKYDPDDIAKAGAEVHITNSLPNSDPHCPPRVSEAARRVLIALGAEKTVALCEAARAADERAGLRPTAIPVPLPPAKPAAPRKN